MAKGFPRELHERYEFMGHIAHAFQLGQFSVLEEMASEALKSRRRTSSGSWLYPQVYAWAGASNEKQYLEMEAKARQWIAKNPRSTPAHLTYARLLINHAWMLRGGGFAHQVAEAGWSGFGEQLGKARSVLEQAREFSQTDPEWHRMILQVATEQSWSDKDFYKALEDALEAHPSYTEIYFAAARRFQPRWGGNLKQTNALLDRAVSLTKESEGTSYYARLYLNARNDDDVGGNLIDQLRSAWPRLRSAFDDLIQRYPTTWNRNGYASFACLAGDKVATREQMSKIGDDVQRGIWSDSVSPDACRRWADER